ncbi:CpG cytosine-specific DNA modification methyltransferase [Mesomycoplasma neurolyticum]|uniref:CpG cytosine-specific DNA modification methyltransferase n=1 Tax=Mesomycoplasma neurolyticum TaxID=2120 RepID=A0A449A4Q5_9BACT|nr:CpG cytosine-specific DNA modification methyltransferase [Mesomycoplasma neurolyticum]
MWEVKRILEHNLDNLPKILVMENVKSLLQKKFAPEFNEWINFLKTLGYNSDYKVLNSQNYGSSQNRERVIMISTLANQKFIWPKEVTRSKQLENILNPKYDNENEFQKWDFLLKQINENDFKTTINGITKLTLKNYTRFNSENYIYLPINKGPTLTASGANSRLKFYFQDKKRIRTMNAIEAYKYMGFNEKKAQKILDSELIDEKKMIFTAGNSIPVEMLEKVFEQIVIFLQNSSKINKVKNDVLK